MAMTLDPGFPLPVTTILTSAVAPVTLITGVAFLTSIMAPRFGRCIDRIRSILSNIQAHPENSRAHRNNLEQLRILYARTRILRNTLTVAGICIFFVVLTIGATFSHLITGVPGTNLVAALFLLALIWLLLLAVGFIYDFVSSLKAVKLEIECGVGCLEAMSLKPDSRQRLVNLAADGGVVKLPTS